ncbi:MAG: cytochrome b N-terminal domain-containing protein, partial [Chloroflexota bacterium]
MTVLWNWLAERLGAGKALRAIFLRPMPRGVNWWYSLGSAALFLFLLQVLTGTLLAMNYAPTPDHAYDSIRFIMSEVASGWFIRGLHHWGASVMVIVVVAHLITVFIMGAHRYPREATWLFGVGLLLLTIGFGFTGYLLPWDQKAYWATTVGTNMIGTIPGVGPALLVVVRGGAAIGAVTLTRFYAMHVLMFPMILSTLAAVHVALVIYHGVSVPPGLWHREASAPQPATSGDREATYAERYAAFKRNGPSFWPELIAKDFTVALALLLVLVTLTV